jgi:hypothetical protein
MLGTWGRKKLLVTFTLQGKVTEKQAEKIYERMMRIAERYDLGYGETEPEDVEY